MVNKYALIAFKVLLVLIYLTMIFERQDSFAFVHLLLILD